MHGKLNALLNKDSEGVFLKVVASDELLETLKSTEQSTYLDAGVAVTDDDGKAIVIIPYVGGKLRFKVTAKSSTSTGSYTKFTIGSVSTTVTTTDYTDYTVDISCHAGEGIAITMNGADMSTNRHIYIKSVKVYGTLVQDTNIYRR